MSNNNKWIKNQRAKWILTVQSILLKLLQGELPQFPKIPKSQFTKATSEQQKQMLKSKLGDVLKYGKVPIDKNLLCFDHDDRSPSLKFYQDSSCFYCFACRKRWDIFDIIGVLFGIKSFPGKKLKAIELFVEDGEKLPTVSHKTNSGGSSDKKPFRYKSYSEDADCVEYLKQRGITIESAEKFNLKYWLYDGQIKYLTIPCDNWFCSRRKITEGFDEYGKYFNPLEKQVSLFNGKGLNNTTEGDFVFVVESAIDAITLDQMGYKAVALNGLHYTLLLDKTSLIRDKRLKLILLLDNDSDGRKASLGFAKKLKALKIPFYWHFYDKFGTAAFLSHYKDLNSAYVANKEETTKAIEDLSNLFNGKADCDIVGLPSNDISKKFDNPLESFGIVATLPFHELNKKRGNE